MNKLQQIGVALFNLQKITYYVDRSKKPDTVKRLLFLGIFYDAIHQTASWQSLLIALNLKVKANASITVNRYTYNSTVIRLQTVIHLFFARVNSVIYPLYCSLD